MAAAPGATDCEAGDTLSVKPLTVKPAVAAWVSAPLAPVTVKVTVPGGVVAAVLRVRVEVPGVEKIPGETGLVEKAQLAPAGRPPQDRLTAPLKPPRKTTEIVKVAAAPGATDWEEGESVRSKSGTAATFSSAVAVLTSEPLVPATVKVTVPGTVLLVVLSVRVEVPGGAGLGEKLQLAPEGRPLQDRLTEGLKPVTAPMETVYVPAAPAVTDCEEGETLSVKSDVVTRSSVLAVRSTSPLKPKTVKVTVVRGVVVDVVTVSVEVPGGAGLGEKRQLAPSGRPPQERSTTEVKAPRAVTETV